MAQLSTTGNADLLISICNFLHEAPTAGEVEVVAACNLSAGTYQYWMNALGEQLIAFVGGREPAALQGRAYEVARFLINNLEADAATDILRTAIREATAVEDFGQVIRLWELASHIQPSPALDVMPEREARKLQRNLAAFEDLLADFQEARQIQNVPERQQVMKGMLENGLLDSEERALSKRALKVYLKLIASLRMYLKEWERALVHQKRLVILLESEASISPLRETELVHEFITLMGVLLILRRQAECQEIEEKFGKLELRTPKAEHERISHLLPTRLSAAIQNGDETQTISCIESLLEFLDQHTITDTFFVTGCLYRCLYGAISANHDKIRTRVLRLLSQHAKADFRPQYFAMYRFLEILHALDERDWDLALQRLKNPRRRAVMEQVAGMRELLHFLTMLVSIWEKTPEKEFHLDADATATLLALTSSSEVLEYFDLLVWLEAKSSGRSMLQIFQNRANRDAPSI